LTRAYLCDPYKIMLPGKGQEAILVVAPTSNNSAIKTVASRLSLGQVVSTPMTLKRFNPRNGQILQFLLQIP